MGASLALASFVVALSGEASFGVALVLCGMNRRFPKFRRRSHLRLALFLKANLFHGAGHSKMKNHSLVLLRTIFSLNLKLVGNVDVMLNQNEDARWLMNI